MSDNNDLTSDIIYRYVLKIQINVSIKFVSNVEFYKFLLIFHDTLICHIKYQHYNLLHEEYIRIKVIIINILEENDTKLGFLHKSVMTFVQ